MCFHIELSRYKLTKNKFMLPLQRNKVGFLLSNVGPSELSYNILNRGMIHSDDIDTVIFFEQITKPCIDSLVAKMHISEAYHYDGPIIATCLNTLNKLLTFPSPHPKLFFLNDLEWLRLPNKNFAQLEYLYRNPHINLICRSNEHKKLVESCWNRKVKFIAERYNLYTPEILSFITENSRGLYKEKVSNKTLNIKSLNL